MKPKPVLPPDLQKKEKATNEQEINEVSKVNVENEVLNKLLNEVMTLTAYIDRKKISKTQVGSYIHVSLLAVFFAFFSSKE